MAGIVIDVSEYHGTTGLATRRHDHVTTSDQDGTMEFRRLAIPDIDHVGIGEIPQHTGCHARGESADSVSHQSLVGHGACIDSDSACALDVDQDGLATAVVAEFDGVDTTELVAFVGHYIENLNGIVLGTFIGRFSFWIAPVFVEDLTRGR